MDTYTGVVFILGLLASLTGLGQEADKSLWTRGWSVPQATEHKYETLSVLNEANAQKNSGNNHEI